MVQNNGVIQSPQTQVYSYITPPMGSGVSNGMGNGQQVVYPSGVGVVQTPMGSQFSGAPVVYVQQPTLPYPPQYQQPIAYPTAYSTPASSYPTSSTASTLIGMVPRVASGVLAKIANRVVDAVLGDDYSNYSEMYDELGEMLDKNQTFKNAETIRRERERRLHELEMMQRRKEAELFELNRRIPSNPVEAAMMEANEIKHGILESLRNIEIEKERLLKLQEKSRCSLCKATLGDVAKHVHETVKYAAKNTHQIIDATDKVVAMQVLKSEGRLDRNKKWENLTEGEKEMVRQKVIELNGQEYYDRVYSAFELANDDNPEEQDDADESLDEGRELKSGSIDEEELRERVRKLVESRKRAQVSSE